jgi:predicted TPR repeat methyltransferase
VRHAEAYSRLAGVYDEVVVDPSHDRCAAFLHDLWSADPEGVRSVLDLCCGTGLLASELIARGYRVAGVDASDAMLARARERLGPDVALSCTTLRSSPATRSSTRRFARSTASTTSLRPTCDERCSPWPYAFGPPNGSSSTFTPTG